MLLGSLWHLFGSIWRPLVTLWYPWAPIVALWDPLGLALAPLWLHDPLGPRTQCPISPWISKINAKFDDIFETFLVENNRLYVVFFMDTPSSPRLPFLVVFLSDGPMVTV